MLSAWAALSALGSAPGAGEHRARTAFVLARAGACARLADGTSQEAYTVGLLSGAAEALGVPVGELLAGVHLREDLQAALTRFEGPVGSALAAVLQVEPRTDAQALPEVPEQVLAEAVPTYVRSLGEALTLTESLGG